MKQRFYLLLMTLLFCIFGCAGSNKVSHHSYGLADGVDQLSSELIASTDLRAAGKVAVLYFVGPQGNVTELGELLTDKLSVRLFQSRSFSKMMERKQLKTVLNAKNEELSEYFDFFNTDTVHEFGQMIGVDSLIIGTISDFGTTLEITTKVISSKTGEVLGTAAISVINDGQWDPEPLKGELAVQTCPQASGSVVVGNVKADLRDGNAVVSNLPYGRFQLAVNAHGFDPVVKSVSIYASRETVSVSLAEKQFSVSFQIIPPDATLRVNGNLLELAKDGFAKVTNITPGHHNYCAFAEGYVPVSGTFNPIEESLIRVDLPTEDPYYAVKDNLFKKHQETEKNSAFKIDLWADKHTFQVGDSIVFNFRSERDCYLNIVDINSSGEMTLLFPNRFHQDNFIRSGRTYRIPDETYGFCLEVQPPVGRERIYAIASYHPIDIFDTNFHVDAFSSMTRGVTAEKNVRGIGVKINKTPMASSDELVIDVRH